MKLKPFSVKTAVVLFLILSNFLIAQQNPITWATFYKSVSANEGEILITGTLEKGWHTYSQKVNADGPIATSFTFAPHANYSLNEKTQEIGIHEEYVKAFDAKISVFSGKAEFVQKIKLKSKPSKPFTIPVKVEYMCCNDAMCLPPKIIDLQVIIK
ncbi:MAG: hypothetical protein JSU07_10685 [Bacteroidetes bacterium]|nr:hypothetical protein [Bacteroidota bacterium]